MMHFQPHVNTDVVHDHKMAPKTHSCGLTSACEMKKQSKLMTFAYKEVALTELILKINLFDFYLILQRCLFI